MLEVNAFGLCQLGKLHVGILLFKVAERHLIVVCLNIAQFGAALAHLGQCRFQLHHLLHLLLGHTLLETIKLEHTYDMLLVGFTDFCRSLIVIKIIFLLSQRQAALIDVQDVHLCVLLVGTESHIHKLLVAIKHQVFLDVEQFFLRLGSLHLIDYRHHGLHAFLVAAFLVHGEFIEVRELLLNSSLGISSFEKLVENAIDAFVVVFLQTVEASIAGIGCGQRIVLHPSATGILVEIILRTNICVEISHHQPRLQFLSAGSHRSRCNQYSCHHCSKFHNRKYLMFRNYLYSSMPSSSSES